MKTTNDKITYEQNMAGERSTTTLFNYFRAFRKENLPKKMNYEKASADNDLSKANLFATYFASVYTHSTTFHQTSVNSDVKVVNNICFGEKEVMTKCNDLKINKSKGPETTSFALQENLSFYTTLSMPTLSKNFTNRHFSGFLETSCCYSYIQKR